MEGQMAQEGMAHTPEKKPERNIGLIAALTVPVVAFLIPTLFIPIVTVPVQFTKVFLVVIATALLLSIFALRSLKRGVVVKYWSLSLVAFSIIPVVYLVSAVFSASPSRSFFGYRLEFDTFGFMLLLVLFVNALVLTVSRVQLGGIFKSLLFGTWAVFVFQLIQVLFNAPFGLAALNNPIANTLGKWNDIGVFAGLVGALSLLALMSMRLKQMGKTLLIITFVVSLFFLALVNLTEAWILFGLVAFSLFAMMLSQVYGTSQERIGIGALTLPAIGVVAAVFFVLFGGGVSGALQGALNIDALEVRPSVAGRVGIMQQVYAESPVLGSGPNTFTQDWLQFRDDAVLNTVFWNANFTVGSGIIPTTFITGGILTALVWILFSLLVIYTVFRALFLASMNSKLYVLTTLSGVSVLYLLVMHYLYAPSQSLTLLFALMFGLFLVSLKDTPLLHTVRMNMSSSHMQRVLMVGSVVVLVLALSSVYGVGRTYASNIYHERAVQVANAGNVARGEQLIETAMSLRTQDRYYRTAALINLAQINTIVNAEETSDELIAAFQNQLASAVRNANTAVALDQASFSNWITRAVVYSSAAPFQIDGAFENAIQTLEEARSRSPKTPEIDYQLAELYVIQGDTEMARTFLEAALTKKQDYTQAILLLAQIELDEGNLTNAIDAVRAAVFFEPDSPVLLYQLGILLLQDQNYEESALAFEAALQRQPNYSNAAFFLAQSYAFLDRIDEAADIMANVSVRNPDSDVARDFAAALSRGENPFDVGEVASPEEEVVEVE